MDARLDEIMRILESDRNRIDQIMEIHRQSHQREHSHTERTIEKSELTSQREISDIKSSLDRLEEAHATFVGRDRHDAEVGVIRDRMERLERDLRSKLETDINATTVVITELKSKLADINARFQQSIVALGIILTILEVWLRR